MSPLRLLLLVAVAAFLVTFVQLGLLRVAFDRLGLSSDSAVLLLAVTLAGSFINLPLFAVKTDAAAQEALLRAAPHPFPVRRLIIPGKTLIAVNVGGCVVPLAFSAYLLAHSALGLPQVAAAIAAVTAVSYSSSYSLPRIGIVMPMLIAPLAAAFVALLLDAQQAPALAYIGGTLGVLIGADILRLKDIGRLGEPVASIGGAGSFDGIFVTGLIAVLLT